MTWSLNNNYEKAGVQVDALKQSSLHYRKLKTAGQFGVPGAQLRLVEVAETALRRDHLHRRLQEKPTFTREP